MELYQLYNFIATTFQIFFETMAKVYPNFTGGFSSYGAWLFTSLGIAFGLWAILFLLQAFGLYYMAKKQNISKRYLAFIPFANTWYMSKLAGKCTFFGRKMKNAGIYALVAQILCVLVCSLTIAVEIYLNVNCLEYIKVETTTDALGIMDTKYHWIGSKGFSSVLFILHRDYFPYITPIFTFAYNVFMFIVASALIRKYAPKYHFFISLLAFIEPLSRYIIIFVLKKKQPVDYDDWMRRRRADFIYRQQQANPYNNPYGPAQNGQNGQNGQNAQGASQNTQSAPSDPFEEFSSNPSNTSGQSENSGTNTQTGASGSSGDFFD